MKTFLGSVLAGVVLTIVVMTTIRLKGEQK